MDGSQARICNEITSFEIIAVATQNEIKSRNLKATEDIRYLNSYSIEMVNKIIK